MSGTTPGGVIFPTGTDFVRDGDNALQNVAESFDQDPVELQVARSGSQNVLNNTWTRMHSWGSSAYVHGSGLNIVAGTTGGIQVALAGRYYVEAWWLMPANMTGKRGTAIGVAAVGAATGPPVRTQNNVAPISATSQIQQLQTSCTVSAGAGEQISGWMWQETGGTVVADATYFGLLVRRLRLGQAHA